MLIFSLEVQRASENLAKSGKMIPGMHGRRESLPLMGTFARQYQDFRKAAPNLSISIRPMNSIG